MLKKIEDIEVWNKAREFCREIFEVYSEEPFCRDYGLKDQINRASGSIMDNIAEGFGRMGNREFINFLSYSKGSCLEVKSQIYRALDRNYIGEERAKELLKKLNVIDTQIGSFMNYLKTAPQKGAKFN